MIATAHSHYGDLPTHPSKATTLPPLVDADSAFMALLREAASPLDSRPAAPEPTSPSVSISFDPAAMAPMPVPVNDPLPEFKLPSGWYADAAVPKSAAFPIKPATIGFVVGILVLLPATIGWQKMTSGQPRAPSAMELADMARSVIADATAHAGRLAPGPAFDQARVERIAARTLTAPTFEPQLDEAKRLIAAREIQAARDLLATASAAKSPRALFAMAETFDPNLLAAWGADGIAADPARARDLYLAARTLGHDGTDGRIEALR